MNYRNLDPWEFMLIPIEKREKEKINICGGKLRRSIECSDDETMQKIQIRNGLTNINFSIFEKTKSEKEAAKRVKKEFKGHSFEKSRKNKQNFAYPAKLIVYVKNVEKLKNFPTTRPFTVSSIEEINEILYSGTFFNKEHIQNVFLNNKKYSNA